MSLEQAILDHAAAIRELAAAFVQSQQNSAAALAKLQEAYAAGTPREEAAANQAQRDAEIEAVQKVDADDIKKAVEKVEADAKAETGKSDAGSAAQQPSGDTAGSAKEKAGIEQKALDYETDVKPVLVKLASAKGKDELTKLIKSFGVAKATELNAEQLAQALDQAKKLLAA